MQRVYRSEKRLIEDIVAGLDAGEDLRLAMARINAQILDYQRAGERVPDSLRRLATTVANECAAQSQGR